VFSPGAVNVLTSAARPLSARLCYADDIKGVGTELFDRFVHKIASTIVFGNPGNFGDSRTIT
jgi:hypothetical protein